MEGVNVAKEDKNPLANVSKPPWEMFGKKKKKGRGERMKYPKVHYQVLEDACAGNNLNAQQWRVGRASALPCNLRTQEKPSFGMSM